MLYLVIILGVAVLFICIKLKIENFYLKMDKEETIQKVRQDIVSIQEKQTEIFDKVLLNKSYSVDLNIEIKQLSKEVLELHQDFITKYAR
jgi:hypothetical protein